MIAGAASRVLFCFFEEEDRGLSKGCSITATASYFRLAVWVFAYEFAFWLGAFWFGTFPVASGLLAYSFAFGFGGLGLLDTWQ